MALPLYQISRTSTYSGWHKHTDGTSSYRATRAAQHECRLQTAYAIGASAVPEWAYALPGERVLLWSATGSASLPISYRVAMSKGEVLVGAADAGTLVSVVD